MNLSDKKKIINLIPPTETNIQTGNVSLHINTNQALRKILRSSTHLYYNDPLQSTCDNKSAYSKFHSSERTTIKKAIAVLIKNNIQVNEEEPIIILEFLYLFAQYYNKLDTLRSLNRYLTDEKR